MEITTDIARLRGSKYVQSEISADVYRSIKQALESGRKVLFSGTPCQVSGLRNFLRHDYENLITCDLICHGVPSPRWFRRYVEEREKQESSSLKVINMRSKHTGWHGFGVKEVFVNGKASYFKMFENPYLCSFLRNYTLRYSCHNCKFAKTTRVGDITIADFWGVRNKYPQYDLENKGTSLILVNTQNGNELLNKCREMLFLGHATMEDAISGNSMLIRASKCPEMRKTFLVDCFREQLGTIRGKYKLYPIPLVRRIVRKIFIGIPNRIRRKLFTHYTSIP